MDKLVNVIALDGPSGSGKSTIAKIIAQKLKITYLDTGAMFRGLAYFLDSLDIKADNDNRIKEELDKINFEYQGSADCLIAINGEDLTDKIREHHVSKLASIYSQNLEVRGYLKKLQRDIAGKRASILDGRDIGTVIFPDAVLKVFLTADPEVRAHRRLKQLQEQNGSQEYNLENILADIIKRDDADRNREIAPLLKANDAIEIDSTALIIEEIVNQVITEYSKRVS